MEMVVDNGRGWWDVVIDENTYSFNKTKYTKEQAIQQAQKNYEAYLDETKNTYEE